MVMNQIIQEAKEPRFNVKVGNWNLEPIYMQCLIYADDIVLLADSTRKLQLAINKWNRAIERRGMKINTNKTKIMKIEKNDTNENTRITCNGKELEWVNNYEYLGTVINKTGTIEQEILNRRDKASKVYYAINKSIIAKKEVSMQTKLRVYKTIYTPVLTYGAESWTIQDKTRSKITASEMKYLRRLVGRTKRDRIRNIITREEVGQQPLIQEVEKRQLQWYGHIVRMSRNRDPRRILEAKPEGTRSRGRPRETWEQSLEKRVEQRGKHLREIKRMAANRDSFRRWLEDPML